MCRRKRKWNPRMDELQALNSKVRELLNHIDSLVPALETKKMKEEISEIKCRLDARDKLLVNINKFCIWVLHNSMLALPLLHDRTTKDEADK